MNESQEQRASRASLARWLYEQRALILITLLGAGLMFLGLTEHAFWSDEAITAIYSRNTLKYGLPYAFDGRNLCAYGTGTSISPSLLATAYPWLQFYVAAASYGVWGRTSTLAGRLPFALIGLAVVPLTYLLARRFRQGRGAGLLAALLLACSPQYLLFMRQCRYFALTVLFSVLMLLLYPRVRLKKKASWILFAAMAVLLFYSHFLMMIVFYLSLAICFCVFERDLRRFGAFLIATGIALAVTLPWLLVLPSHEGGAEVVGSRLARSARLLWWYVRDLNGACFLPAAILILLPLVIRDRRRAKEKSAQPELFLLCLIVCYVAILCLVSPQPLWRTVVGQGGVTAVTAHTADADIRYAVSLMPVMAILMGAAIWAVWRRTRVGGVLLTALLLFTNLATFTRPRFYLYDYVREFTCGYETSTEAVLRVLAADAEQDDLVWVMPPYQRDPLMFYLGDRFRFCGILPSDDKRILPVQKDDLPRYIYSVAAPPRFIVSFKSLEEREFPQSNLKYVRLAYEEKILDCHWRDWSRPELIWRRFRPPEPREPSDRVFIYVRKKPAPKRPRRVAPTQPASQPPST